MNVTQAKVNEFPVQIVTAGVELLGNLAVPRHAKAVVLFAHGSGSSRHSPRNQFVAKQLQRGGLATLLMDLLTVEEEAEDERTGELRFDIGLLAERLMGATRWIGEQPATTALPIGYFGASTGAGAALVAAAQRPAEVRAIVSRGGRPDLAGPFLSLVSRPTLLIVGGADEPVIDLNARAMQQMHCKLRLALIPGATHLFEEPGALDEVARLARGWFEEHLI